jgi:hypothetical protein
MCNCACAYGHPKNPREMPAAAIAMIASEASISSALKIYFNLLTFLAA